MRLVKIAKTPTKNMLQVDIPEGSGVWGFCPAEVKAYAQQNLKEGDEVEMNYKFENGQLNISFIKKAGQGSYTPPQQGSQQSNQQPQQSGFTCEVCGKPLRDDRYKKCYTCNQNKNTPPASNFKCEDCGKALRDGKYDRCFDCNKKAPKQTKSGRDTGESIERQNCNNATSRALIALQGQVDLNNIISVIDNLWETFYAKLEK